jgi:hypothetical protein
MTMTSVCVLTELLQGLIRREVTALFLQTLARTLITRETIKRSVKDSRFLNPSLSPNHNRSQNPSLNQNRNLNLNLSQSPSPSLSRNLSPKLLRMMVTLECVLMA